MFGVTHSTNEGLPRLYAARYVNLGLTAYGDSEEEAIANLGKALNTYVRNLAKRGTLTERLARAGVTWYWEHDTPGWAWVSPTDNGPFRESVSERVAVSI
jgi:hypothetical protein